MLAQSRKFFREKRAQLDDIRYGHSRALTFTPALELKQRKNISGEKNVRLVRT